MPRSPRLEGELWLRLPGSRPRWVMGLERSGPCRTHTRHHFQPPAPKITPKGAPIALLGQILPPSPPTNPAPPQAGLADPQPHRTGELQEFPPGSSRPPHQEGPATTPEGRRGRGGRHFVTLSPPPKRDRAGDGDLAAHLFRSIHPPAARRGAFAGGAWCTRTREQREAPAPPSLCLSAEEFHLQGKPAPTPKSRRGEGRGPLPAGGPAATPLCFPKASPLGPGAQNIAIRLRGDFLPLFPQAPALGWSFEVTQGGEQEPGGRQASRGRCAQGWVEGGEGSSALPEPRVPPSAGLTAFAHISERHSHPERHSLPAASSGAIPSSLPTRAADGPPQNSHGARNRAGKGKGRETKKH